MALEMYPVLSHHFRKQNALHFFVYGPRRFGAGASLSAIITKLRHYPTVTRFARFPSTG